MARVLCLEHKLQFDNFIVVDEFRAFSFSIYIVWRSIVFITFPEIFMYLFIFFFFFLSVYIRTERQHKCAYVTYEFVFVICFAQYSPAYTYIIRTPLKTDHHPISNTLYIFIYITYMWLLNAQTVSPMIWVPNQLVGAPAGTDVTIDCNTEAHPK